MQTYLETHYSENAKPYTTYPFKLCQHLFGRFGIRTGGTVADVGCGRGEFLQGFKELGLDAYGLDLRRFEGKLLDQFDIRTANIERERFPYDDEMFDLVFSKSVIEHLHNPENFMRECWRILRPGGRIIIMTPDWQSHRYVFYGDHTHVQPYVEAGLANALRMYGFHDVHAELFYQLPWVWKRRVFEVALKPLRLLFPIKKSGGNSFWRWSRELMILGTGVKTA